MKALQTINNKQKQQTISPYQFSFLILLDSTMQRQSNVYLKEAILQLNK